MNIGRLAVEGPCRQSFMSLPELCNFEQFMDGIPSESMHRGPAWQCHRRYAREPTPSRTVKCRLWQTPDKASRRRRNRRKGRAPMFLIDETFRVTEALLCLVVVVHGTTGCCGGLDSFRYLSGFFLGPPGPHLIIARNCSTCPEKLKNRTCLDFERGQWTKNHKIGATRVHDVVIFIP